MALAKAGDDLGGRRVHRRGSLGIPLCRAHVRHGGKMGHHLRLGHAEKRVQLRPIGDFQAMPGRAIFGRRPRMVRADDRVAGGDRQTAGHVAADEPAGANDQDTHGSAAEGTVLEVNASGGQDTGSTGSVRSAGSSTSKALRKKAVWA